VPIVLKALYTWLAGSAAASSSPPATRSRHTRRAAARDQGGGAHSACCAQSASQVSWHTTAAAAAASHQMCRPTAPPAPGMLSAGWWHQRPPCPPRTGRGCPPAARHQRRPASLAERVAEQRQRHTACVLQQVGSQGRRRGCPRGTRASTCPTRECSRGRAGPCVVQVTRALQHHQGFTRRRCGARPCDRRMPPRAHLARPQ
jgi:hypothetical protein